MMDARRLSFDTGVPPGPIPRWAISLGRSGVAQLLSTLLWMLLLFFALTLAGIAAIHLTAVDQPVLFEVQVGKRIPGHTMTEDHFSVTVINNTQHNIVIEGANANCGPRGCTSVDSLPLAVPPFGRKELTIRHSNRINHGSAVDTLSRDIVLDFYVNNRGRLSIVPLTIPAGAIPPAPIAID